MSEGGMTEVVSEANCLRKVLIEVEGAGYGAGYLRDLQGMGKPGHIMVTQWGNEDLSLVLESAESLGVDNTVAVSLEGGSN